MKIILSRKGFDSSNGGCPSPIFPDGTMLSLPIPSDGDGVKYKDLSYNGVAYEELIRQLSGKEYTCCHLDPDLRRDICNRASNWSAAFGQTGAAQGLLRNAGVEEGDIFLFFGWFRGVTNENDSYRYTRYKDDKCFYSYADLHVIYGYMQIGKILTSKEDIQRHNWHPHSREEYFFEKNNALYIPAERLSLNPELPGYGTLDFSVKRVLTMENGSRATWIPYEFLTPDPYKDKVYGNKKNSSQKGGLYYAGVWQELVVYESPELIDWVKEILSPQ